MKKENNLPITTHTISKNLLLFVSFIEGGAVMIIELLGAKIIAPYYGTSLFVWSSVLGITLGALALGYFLGGQISKKYSGEHSLFMVLLVGTFFTGIGHDYSCGRNRPWRTSNAINLVYRPFTYKMKQDSTKNQTT